MPAISEYARVASGQRLPPGLPASLGEAVRWLAWILVAYLAIRLGLGVLRWLARK